MGDAHYMPQPALPEVPGRGARQIGSPSARPSCCRCRTSTSSSRCRRRSPRSPSRTRRRSTPSCSEPRPRRCARSPPIREHLGRRDRLLRGAPHLGPEPAAPSACPLRRPRRRLVADGMRWVACRPGFFLPVRVLSRLFRRLFLDELRAAFDGRQTGFFGALAGLADRTAFARRLQRTAAGRVGGLCQAPLRRARTGARPISAATRTASRSPTPAGGLTGDGRSASAGATTASQEQGHDASGR